MRAGAVRRVSGLNAAVARAVVSTGAAAAMAAADEALAAPDEAVAAADADIREARRFMRSANHENRAVCLPGDDVDLRDDLRDPAGVAGECATDIRRGRPDVRHAATGCGCAGGRGRR